MSEFICQFILFWVSILQIYVIEHEPEFDLTTENEKKRKAKFYPSKLQYNLLKLIDSKFIVIDKLIYEK